MAMSALLGINLSLVLGIIFVVLSLSFFVLFKVFNREKIKWEWEQSDILLCSMICLAIIAKVVSVIGMYTPNPSDEITHAYFAKLIIDTGFPSFFYSPGIHIFSAFSTMFGGDGVAKQILFLTNFFSAYSGVMVYLFIKHIFRDKISALVSALLYSLGIALSFFFYAAGKNAMIAGVSVLFFFIFVVSMNRKSYSLKTLVLSSILLFVTFIVHYPIGVFACIFWASLFLVDIKTDKRKNLFIFFGAILGLIYLIKAYLVNLDPTEVSTIEKAFVVPESIVDSFVAYFNLVVTETKTFAFRSYPLIMFYFSILGFVSVLWFSFKSKLKDWYRILLLWTVGSFLLCSLIAIFSIEGIHIVLETYVLSNFMLSYIYFAFTVSLIIQFVLRFIPEDKFFYLFTIIFVVFSMLLGISTFNTFHGKKESSIVKNEDIYMFEWIDSNIKDDRIGIITNGYIYTTLVLPSDSGGWLGIFAGNRVSTPFWEFAHNRTYSNYENYLDIQENLRDCESLQYFKDNGFSYYFQGSTPHVPNSLGSKEELETNGWELVHSEGNVYLYKIPSCE